MMALHSQSTGLALMMAVSVALAAASLLAAPEAKDAKDAKDESRELTGQVHVLFEKKCKSCHGGQLKEPEGEFGYVLDLPRLTANLEIIVKGDPAKSKLFQLVKDAEMPPSDSKVAPLTAEERELIRRWIAAGAPAVLPAKLPQNDTAKPPSTPAKAQPPSDPGAASAAAAAAMREKAKQTTVTLDLKDQPASEVFAQVAKAWGLKVDYAPPAHEPRLSIRLKDGTVFQALEYLALCGNFSLGFDEEGARIGPNPPREPPKAVRPAPK